MPKPVLQSLILADHVYEDKLTGKRIIAGVFNRIIRGVRVLKQMGPPLAPPPLPPAAPQYLPPPPQPAEPPAYSPEDFSAPPQYASPNLPTPPAAPAEPIAPAAPAAPPPAPAVPPTPTSFPSAPVSQPTPVAQPAPISPVEQPSVPPPPPAPRPAYRHPELPPETPLPTPAAQTPRPMDPNQLQPGQRLLEIPPTGLQSGSPFAYLSLTEVRGNMNFVLQLMNLEDDTQLFRSDLRVECHNPLLTVEMTVPLPPISPPQAGIYALELLWNSEILGSLRIIVEDAVTG
jgi:hypothetical protein